jgi:hypothetical protein
MIKQMFAAVLMVLSAAAQAQENSTVLKYQMPDLGDQDADAIYCRPPMALSGRRLLGPKTCKPQAVWDDLHKKGLDLAPDGKTVVGSEKYRSVQCASAGC